MLGFGSGTIYNVGRVVCVDLQESIDGGNGSTMDLSGQW